LLNSSYYSLSDLFHDTIRFLCRGGSRPKLSELVANYDRHQKFPDVEFNISAERLATALLDVAENGRSDLKRDAKDLVNKMAKESWWVAAGAHSGGLGGGGHAADPRPHITVRISGKGHHIYYGFKSGQFIVTGVS